MLKSTRTKNSQGLLIYLCGEIDERCDFDEIFGSVEEDLQVNCRGISRINSAGVRNWALFFRKLFLQERKVRFLECSPVVVAQANLVPEFLCHYEMASAYAPFFCSACGSETQKLFTPETFPASGEPQPVPCQKCEGEACFDDDPNEYFRMWLGEP